jgi:hypothetical protein
MLDRIIFHAPIKPYLPSDAERFYPGAPFDGLSAKVQQRPVYWKTPLTGANIEITPSIDKESRWLVLTLEVFVAAALAGQGWFHGGIESIPWEISGSGLITRIALRELGFTQEEVERFMLRCELDEVECTWHRRTATGRAARSLLERCHRHFRALRGISRFHDIDVADLMYMHGSGAPSLLITFRDGSRYRFYLKADQLTMRFPGKKQTSFLAPELGVYRSTLLQGVPHGLRCEPIMSNRFLSSRGMSHPISLTPDSIRSALDDFMRMGCLDRPFATRLEEVDMSELRDEHLRSLHQYFDGEDVMAALPSHTATRHRRILGERGVELAVPLGGRTAALGKTLWQQIAYDARHVPAVGLEKFYVSEQAWPDIECRLRKALADAIPRTL